jgi:glucosamine--fructose-6-phosphate aminotransferase (isomerizing)
MVVACNGSPLVIGLGDSATFVASETTAFNRHTKEFIAMKDGEIGVLTADRRSLDLSRVQLAPDQEVELSPAPWPHWTLCVPSHPITPITPALTLSFCSLAHRKEMFEQPEAISRALGFGGRVTRDGVKLGGLDSNKERLERVRHVTLAACGTSLNAAMYGAKLMRSLGSFDSAVAMDAAETTTRDLAKAASGRSGVIVVSQSGETKDVQRVVVGAMNEGFPVISVVNAVGSLVARTTSMGVYLNAGRENAVASTKAFTTQVTVLALLAIWWRRAHDAARGGKGGGGGQPPAKDIEKLIDELSRLPISFGVALQGRDKCKRIAALLQDKEHLFVLGRGYAEPVAYEGALKIKETSYLHAEGYSGGALKHGPFALIEGQAGKQGATPVILIVLDDEHATFMRTAAEEVKARGADVFVITDKAELAKGIVQDDDHVVEIPSNGALSALIAVAPLQLIAYELALLRGVNPDVPRNLAKAVTVD